MAHIVVCINGQFIPVAETQPTNFKIAVSKGKVSVLNTKSKEIMIFHRSKISLTLIRSSASEGMERLFGEYADLEDLAILDDMIRVIKGFKPHLLPMIVAFSQREK